MNKNIRHIILAALSLLTTATATAQRELHLFTHVPGSYTSSKVDSAYVWYAFDASRIDSLKVGDHIDVAPGWMKAEVEGNSVHITWSSVNDVPRYHVYRSTDGETWEVVSGSDGECEAYDQNPMFGTNYYRVCASSISYEGPFSEVTSVEVAPEIYAYNNIFKPLTFCWTTHDDFGLSSILLATDVMSEDIAFGASTHFIYDYGLNYRTAQWARTGNTWDFFYNTIISYANQCIIPLKDSPTTTGEKWLLAQAYALRGMAYMYLLQIYCDYMAVGKTDGELTPINREAKGVPILFTPYDGKSDEEIQAARGRNTVGDVIDEIERNLLKADALYGNGQDAGVCNYNQNLSREGISCEALHGFMARFYLLTQNWEQASNYAQQALTGNATKAHDLTDGFMNVFADDVLWGFNHTAETSTVYASFFSHMSNDTPGYAGLNYGAKLIDARLYAQIPDNDRRKQLFNGPDGDRYAANPGAQNPYAARKFGFIDDWSMDYIYMRQAEMVLINAEANARMGQNEMAAQVLKPLMDAYYDGGWDVSSVSVDDVLLQRRIELWGEGFSFFDLKRLNKGIDRNYEGSNHLDGYKLQVPAHDPRWTYQIPNRAFDDFPSNVFHLDPETDQNP